MNSDRGYLFPEIVFDFILNHGGHVLGTIKCMFNLWPFNYSRYRRRSDKRTFLDINVAPTLFLKSCGDDEKILYVFCLSEWD